MTKIDITIPILDEEDTLERQITKVVAYLQSSFPRDYDIRLKIADNGSTDRSPQIGALLSTSIPMVDYLRVGDRGVGRALKYSWTRSDAQVVGYMDLDLATDLRYLPPALAPLVANEADVVSGTRLGKGSKVVGRSLVRAVTSRAFNQMVRMYFGTSFTDGMCGFKFLRREHLERLMELGAVSDGWFFATELLVCAEFAGLRVVDLPVHWTDDPNSKVKIGKLSMEYLAAMGKLKRHLHSMPSAAESS